MDIAKFVFQAYGVEGVIVVRKRFTTEGGLLCQQAEALLGRTIASLAITPEPLTFITEIQECWG